MHGALCHSAGSYAAAGCQAMPRFLTDAEKEAVNARHVAQIRLDLGRWQNEDRPGADAAHGEEGERGGAHVGKLLQLPAGETQVVRSMEQIMNSADAQHNAVVKLPSYVDHSSNRDEVFSAWLYNSVEGLFKDQVPIRSALFALLPWQRAAAAAMPNPMPRETYTELGISRASMEKLTYKGCRKTPFSVKYSIEADALPVITLAHLPTGSGKSIIAIMAALIPVSYTHLTLPTKA